MARIEIYKKLPETKDENPKFIILTEDGRIGFIELEDNIPITIRALGWIVNAKSFVGFDELEEALRRIGVKRVREKRLKRNQPSERPDKIIVTEHTVKHYNYEPGLAKHGYPSEWVILTLDNGIKVKLSVDLLKKLWKEAP